MRILHFIAALIAHNPFKSIFLSYFILSVYLTINVDSVQIKKYETKDEHSILYIDTINKYVVVSDAGAAPSLIHLNLNSTNTKISVLGQKLIINTKHEDHEFQAWLLFFYLGGAFCGIFTLVAPTADGGEWDIDECRQWSYFKITEMDVEDNQYVYHLQNRLLTTSISKLSHYDIKRLIDNYMENPKLYQKWFSTRQKREDKLKKILD